MYFEEALQTLCRSACPSIRYRIYSEILNESRASEHMIKLQDEILKDDRVSEILNWQKEDGWLGDAFHSGRGPETAIRVLSEKGVSGNNLVIKRALKALKENNETFDNGCLQKVGKILDENDFGGSKMMRAAVFAYAGHEDELLVKEEIKKAIEGFKFILSIGSVNDIVKKYKNKNVFKEGVKWPSIYHLRLLAFTKSWRTDENIKIIINSVKKLVEFSPIPEIKLLYKSQVISPASAFMNDFNPKMDELSSQEWMVWFHRTELLSRLGIVKFIPELVEQINYLKQYLLENNELFKLKLSHYYFHKWNMYIGLSLEKNWRNSISRVCDLTFRSLLILHYSNNLT